MKHAYERTGFARFGRGTVPVLRCARCGCGPDWPLSRDPCPPGLRAGLTCSDAKSALYRTKKAEHRRIVREARAAYKAPE